ncbi:MAG: sigma-54-dependent Fis family transcriptional regulator [Pirellulaceae bacterium]
MPTSLVERIENSPRGKQLLTSWISKNTEIADANSAIAELLSQAQTASGAEELRLVQGTKGQWRTLFPDNSPTNVSTEWLADVLDQDKAGQEADAMAAPIDASQPGLLLVGNWTNTQTRISLAEFDGIAAVVGRIEKWIRIQSRLKHRSERFRELLDATVKWSKSRNKDELLFNVAESATKFLKAERATIFLVDASRQTLIGKPALGVEEGELRIPLHAGVVGRAIETESPQRVDADVASEQAMIHRDVDRALQFKTRNLICVPIFNAAGKTIGAFEVLNKLFGNFDNDDEATLQELAAHAAIAIENTQQVEQLVASKKQVADQAQNQVSWIGTSPEIEQVKKTISRVADTDLAILITGENGTGKEVAAQMVHYLSSRRDQVLVAVNCAAISETLLESELFGHEKGAFTDAHQTRVGKFELANGGTLFLDEIGDMSLSGQAKLLRVLEEKVVVRVGGSTPIPTNARVLAATNQNLAELVREKKFREDLFFRLNVVSIHLPALRERGDDVIQIAEHFLEQFAVKVRRKAPRLTAAAKKRLIAHDWPGNVRELRNMMERIAYLSTEPDVDAADLPFIDSLRPEDENASFLSDGLTLTEATDRFQASFIERNIQRAGGNMTEAAKNMGLHRSNLYRKMKQLGMDAGE